MHKRNTGTYFHNNSLSDPDSVRLLAPDPNSEVKSAKIRGENENRRDISHKKKLTVSIKTVETMQLL
jgi:hypothetical protein